MRLKRPPSKRSLAAQHAFMSGDLTAMPAYVAPRKRGKQKEGATNKVIAKWTAQRLDVWLRRNRRRLVEMQPGVKIMWGWGENGASDWAGAVTFVVKPEHVGMRIARLLVIEAKTDEGVASEAQKDFIREVHAVGGLGGVARNVDDCEAIVGGDKTRLK